jgi:hypothetical protein
VGIQQPQVGKRQRKTLLLIEFYGLLRACLVNVTEKGNCRILIIIWSLEGNNPEYTKSRKTQYTQTGFTKKREIL